MSDLLYLIAVILLAGWLLGFFVFIITWDSYFARFESGSAVPNRDRTTLVLYLSGTVKNEDSVDVWEQSWGFGRP
jgi:hypothetical protein